MEQESGTRLMEALRRFESVCRTLWDEGSPAAVELQAAIVEYTGEMRRVDQLVASLLKIDSELRKTISGEIASTFALQVRELETELARAHERIAAQDGALARKEEENRKLGAALAGKEAEILKLNDRFIKSSSEHDVTRAKQLEDYHKKLRHREAEQESRWEAQRSSLEDDHQKRAAMLQKKHEDLMTDLKQRATALEERYAKRERELALAQEDLRKRKDAEFQARMRGPQP